MRSLVVEDTSILAGLIAEILIQLGHHVRAAGDLDQAAGAIESYRPGLVVVDPFLLEASDRAARSRFLTLISGLPAVFLVDSKAGPHAVRLGGRQAATAMVPKPFSLRQLSDAVAAVLQDAQGVPGVRGMVRARPQPGRPRQLQARPDKVS